MIIGCDIDGVLADFNTAYIEVVKEVTGRDLFPAGYSPADILTWSYPETFGYTTDEITRVWDHIKVATSFWYNLAPLPGAAEFGAWINNLRPYNDVYFITSRVGAMAQLQTMAWLINRVGVSAPTVLISSNKGLCCKALKVNAYIDDKNENCQDVVTSSLGACYMLAQPWNHPQPYVNRIPSLSVFQEVINAECRSV